MHFSWICRAESIMLPVPLSAQKPHCASGSTSSATAYVFLFNRTVVNTFPTFDSNEMP